MTDRYIIVPAAPCHVLSMVGRLRSGDAAELQAAGMPPGRALWRSYRRAVLARAAIIDGEVAAVWGMGGSALGRVGKPWLLTSPTAERARVAFLREGRREVALMLAICPELSGFVDAAYDRACRWLVALEFSLSDPFPFGPHEAPFREYRRLR